MKNLLVTGAAGGIGSEIATYASKKGYRVGLMDANHEKLKEVEAKIENSISLPVDITSEESVKHALETFAETPDGLVNCAGIVRFGNLLEQQVKDFEDVINVNLLGCFIVSCSVARLMKEKRSGNIVNISSISGGKHPAIHSGAYAASKAGVVMLSEQMSLEWGKEGIRVNAISPGFIDSGMSAEHYVDPVERKKREGMGPIQKIGSAKDIANVVMFLLSDESSYVHGENIVVDGGVMNSVLANIGRN
ncbi:MAG: SDR family oxidoreductase [SAR86 cluster bacterium]|nr:SDR family oxidoreductase [SAR86 cluster bacterium]